jgi:hypothetical protein
LYKDLGINEGYHIGSGKPALSITDGGTLNLGAAHPTYMAAGVNIYTTGSDSSKGLFLDSTGNITASGNISASGYLVVQNITASGNISASGTIFGTFQQITGITVLQSDWPLDSGLYESDISNANITSNTVVDVIPDNADYTIVLAAQLLPANVSSGVQLRFLQ